MLGEHQDCGAAALLSVVYVDTEREFARFRITHTDPGVPRTAHIGLVGLEIHGRVAADQEESQPVQCGPDAEFDPWSILEGR